MTFWELGGIFGGNAFGAYCFVNTITVFLMGFRGDHYGLTTTYQVAIGLAFCA